MTDKIKSLSFNTRGIAVLKVEEVFSDSAESSDDLSSEESERSSEEESSESESEDEAAPPVNDLPVCYIYKSYFPT